MRQHGNTGARALRVAAVLLLCAVALLALCSCRPTDFFTEVVISSFADVVDEDNEQVTIVNSPDAEEESDDLAALSWSDSSEQSSLVNTLVVYSSDPTSALSTHNSIYALDPLLEGVEASLGVRLLYNAEDELEEETDEWLDNADDGTSSAGSSGGLGAGSGEGTDADDGSADEEDGGYGGTVAVYNPGDAFTEVPRVESLAVLGTDVAVLAQALGGNGAICAMSEEAFYGTDDADATASCFADVFGSSGDIDVASFAASCLLWEGDGTDPDDLTSIDALVEACGTDGVIVYDQALGDQYDFFTKAQREKLVDANITLVPVDFSTVQGILDAGAAIGDALSESSTCAQDASANYKLYKQAVRSIVKGAAATHGGDLAATSKSGSYNLLTDYNSCPVKTASVVGGSYPTACYVATSVATGWSWEGEGSMDPSRVLLLRNTSYASSPLAFWGQVAGVSPNYASYEESDTGGLELLWPYRAKSASGLSGSGNAYNRWLGAGSTTNTMQAGPSSINEGAQINTSYGLGSCYMPYLVVAATSTKTAAQVRKLAVASIEAYEDSGSIEGYSALPYGGSSSSEGTGIPGAGLGWRSTIGSQNAEGGTSSENPFLSGLSAESVVRANPNGLLGSWTEGSMESVLESVWLTELYSHTVSGCSYAAFNDMSDFSCTIGDYECSTMQEAVQAFYATFYRLGSANLESCYEAVVTDQFEDLQ